MFVYFQGITDKYEYIACQGPKEGTAYDFWRMIDQYDIKLIVMLTKFVENGKVIFRHFLVFIAFYIQQSSYSFIFPLFLFVSVKFVCVSTKIHFIEENVNCFHITNFVLGKMLSVLPKSKSVAQIQQHFSQMRRGVQFSNVGSQKVYFTKGKINHE